MTAFDPNEWEAIAKRCAADLHYLAVACTPDDVIGVDLLTLLPTGPTVVAPTSQPGVVDIDSSIPVGTVAVVNLGSAVMQIQNGPAQGAPSAQGTGIARVMPGALLSMPLGGSVFSFYGRAFDQLLVTRYKSVRDPHGGIVGTAGSFTVDQNAGAGPGGAVIYTAPWPGIIPAYLTDLTVTNVGATVCRVKLFDGPNAATSPVQLEDIQMAIGATVVKDYAPVGRLIATGVLNALEVAGDAGNPKVSAGVI